VEELIIGIDAGNNEVKACGPSGVDKFPSDIGEYRDRRLKQQHSPDDMVWEYNGKKGFAGTLARYESEYNGKMMGSTKAHEDTLLRVLLALHRQDDEVFHLVVGQPIESHTEVQKAKIITMLTGAHRITVNGRAKTLHIADVKVAAEGGASYWSCPVPGVVHQLDIGSGTINWATLIDGRYIDKDSFTMGFGANNTKTYDLEAMAIALTGSPAACSRSISALTSGSHFRQSKAPPIDMIPRKEGMPVTREELEAAMLARVEEMNELGQQIRECGDEHTRRKLAMKQRALKEQQEADLEKWDRMSRVCKP
jgi:plasmid segregation protein ParM